MNIKKLESWLPIEAESDFSIYNLPFGIYSTAGSAPRVGMAIGDKIVDLAALAGDGHFDHLTTAREVFYSDYLNDFIALGKAVTNKVRVQVQEWLVEQQSVVQQNPQYLTDRETATMHMPVQVGDYTDFYSSIEHAANVGKMFRDPDNALLPNWKHIPVGYHGRASSIVISGTPIHRPWGQLKPAEGAPVHSPTQRLDFELETAFIIGKNTQLGETISTGQAEDYIFGLVLFNDWSARDVQKWEYVPLGPFLAKNFASSISPWIVTMEVLEAFRTPGPAQQPEVLDYLKYEGSRNYDINLEVTLQTPNKEENVISQSNFKYMYWNMAQQLAHHSMNGCNMRVGDMMASGTISGKDENAYGSMLELAWAGTKPLTMKDGTTRKFIEDGDTVTMKGYADKEGIRVGFGEVKNEILPAKVNP